MRSLQTMEKKMSVERFFRRPHISMNYARILSGTAARHLYIPLTSSAHFVLTRLKYNSLTCASWLAESGRGERFGLGTGNVEPCAPEEEGGDSVVDDD
jgi:hypothetical protein